MQLPPFWRNLGLVNQTEDVLHHLVDVSHLYETEADALLSLAKGGAGEVNRAIVFLQEHHIAKYKALYKTHYEKKLAAFRKALKGDSLSNVLSLSERNQLHAWQGVIGFSQEKDIASASFLSVVFCICCCPLPGDNISGMPGGDGGQVLLVHRPECPLYPDTEAGRIGLLWDREAQGAEEGFSVGIEIAGFDRPGFAQDVSHVFASEDIMIDDYHVIDLNSFAKVHETRFAIFDLGMKLTSSEQLYRILGKLCNIDVVIEAQRTLYPPEYLPVWK